MRASPIPTLLLALICFGLPACNMRRSKRDADVHKVVVTSPQLRAVTLTQQYACQLRAYRHVKVPALEKGYLKTIAIREGQQVKKGDLLFTVTPVLPPKNAVGEAAEPDYARRDFNYTAPFDGTVDRQIHHQGSPVREGEELTALSDNGLIWAYFNVPEARYLEYVTGGKDQQDPQIELVLANGEKFAHTGKMAAINGDFDNQTGNIAFRADFPNPDHLLRHGQTGNVLIRRLLTDALVVPQRATFAILDKRYVFVVDKDNVAHQREIVIQNELDDIFVIKSGVDVDDKIIVEGTGRVRDGEQVEFEDPQPAPAAARLKEQAE